MMLKRSTTESKPSAKARLVRAGMASLAAASAIAALATGCLDRKVVKAEPKTSNVFVSQIVQTSVDKIDLLFMIDNSTSMADKQQILEDAVPVLVSRLITPICVDDNGAPTGGMDTAGQCSKGQPEFTPINDIHIGIVSSSLGAHGNTDTGLPCVASATGHVNDNAHLIGSVRDPAFPLSSSWNGTGFLAWDPNSIDKPTPGTTDAKTLTTTFTNMIDATGQDGCGYEAQLESWYRFLIDPEPPASVDKVVPTGATQPISVRSSSMKVGTDGKLVLDANGKPTCVGCDTTVLAQRAAFLRPDSLVAIVMLTDENDCSITDDGVGWFVGANSPMPRATAACDANSNDKCCFSCAQGGSPPDGCPSVATDTVCKATPTYANDPNLGDNRNLRCYNQRKRFGFDLLYSTDRYVQGLSNPTLYLQSQLEAGKQVTITNPLYDTQGSGKAQRSSSLVFLAGIIGVPWQDVADDASQGAGTGLTYLTAAELLAKGRWDDLLGTPEGNPAGTAPVPPSDPFMIESIAPRWDGTGTAPTNPIINVPIVASTSNNPTASPINGHEQNIPNKDDLQYACTFKLKTPRVCTSDNNACDCSPEKAGTTTAVTAANSPLCQPAGGGAPTTTQVYAKGYPGARELQVLKDFKDNAIVASICPKKVTSDDPANDPDYGYNPAVGAIIERLKEALKGKCLPRPIETDTTGQVLCKVVEAKQGLGNCHCTVPGRSVADARILPAVQTQLGITGYCSDGTDKTDTRPLCSTWCGCEINQLSGPDLQACQAGSSTTPGYCYVDAAAEVTNMSAAGTIAAQLAKCPATQQQLLKFVDAPTEKTPAQGAIAFIACLGAPVVQVTGTAGTAGM